MEGRKNTDERAIEERKSRNQRQVGSTYEQKAADYLMQHGVQMIASNFSCRQGEIDLIGFQDGCLLFIEVKYRKTGKSGLPEEAVGLRKQQRICRASDYFRMRSPQYAEFQVRFDVVAIEGEEIRWHKNAFPYQPYQRGGSIYW